jgi:putative ATP-dependent endonuclease of OLD family
MKIRRIDIVNFRGIRQLSWCLPPEQTFFVLIGPGDATKSTILTAVERALSDRWNITFTDTDFYNANIDNPIRIRVAVSDLPTDLLGLDELGLHVAGINAAGEWTRDAEDGTDKCVIVELLIEADLEPQWTIYRPGDGEGEDEEQHPLKARHRARFGAFRVDERVEPICAGRACPRWGS